MSTRRTCPACNKTFQRGVRVLFAARTGARRTTVCKTCAAGGLIVVQDRSHAAELCSLCDSRAAVFCSVCAAPRPTVKRGKAVYVVNAPGQPLAGHGRR